MSETTKSPELHAKVTALITHADTAWKESDREYLQTQDESVIDKMTPKAAVDVQANAEQAVTAYKESMKAMKAEELLGLMPEAVQLQVNAANALIKESKDALIESITANTAEGIWTKEALEVMDTKTLESIQKSTQPGNYSAQNAGSTDTGGGAGNGEVDPLLPPGAKLNTEKE